MKLVEFALDLDYVPNEDSIALIMQESGCSRDEAIFQEYEENGKWERKKFDNQTRCIASFFSRLLGRFNTKDTRKILVKCVPEIKGKTILTVSGFCDVQVKFDYASFSRLDDLEKKKVALETLMTGIRIIAEEKGWDMNTFENIYARIVEAGYKNEWMLGKPVKSPDKKVAAHIFLMHEVNQIDIFIVICDKDGREIKRKKLISEIPNEWNYIWHLGKVTWLDDKKVALINRSDELMGTVLVS